MQINSQDIVGKRIGRLVVLEYIKKISPKGRQHYHIYRVKCDCGEVEVTRRDMLLSSKKRCLKCFVASKKRRRLGRDLSTYRPRPEYLPNFTVSGGTK